MTSRSNTLIDNIFVNDLTCSSVGGNITSSISDHFLQFCQTNIFEKPNKNKPHKYARSYKTFNEREFLEELQIINWVDVLKDTINTDNSFQLFMHKIESLLNEMAPIRKLSKNELRLEKRPWITKGILVSMHIRDKLSKRLSKMKNPLEKRIVFKHFKMYRNMIVTLLRRSKGITMQNILKSIVVTLRKHGTVLEMC